MSGTLVEPAVAVEARVAPPSLGVQTRLWFQVGAQSFGGGYTTQFLMRRLFVEEGRWLTDDDFVRFWAMCQLPPGMHVISMAMLMGKHVGGWPGLTVATVGLLLPSALLTALATAVFAEIRNWPAFGGALHRVVPAAVGIGLLMTTQLARPILRQSLAAGPGRTLLSFALLMGGGALTLLGLAPLPVILVGAGVIGALANWRLSRG